MKILQINNYHHVRGGSDRVYFETSKLLEKNGHNVLFFSVKDEMSEAHYSDKYFIQPFNYENTGTLHKIKLAAQFLYNKEARDNLELLIKNEKPDIAHLHIFYGHITSSILPVLAKYNIPTVMSVHDYRMLCPANVMRDSEGKICEKCAEGNYLSCIIGKCTKHSLVYSSIAAMECFVRDQFFSYEKYIDRFIMVSRFILDKHIQYKPSMKSKSEHVYNFIDLDKYSPHFSHEDYYLYFGRLSREKGVMTLLNVWRKFPHVHLKIVGTGEVEEEAKQYIAKHNMSNVEFVGFLNGDALFDVVKRSKFLFVPSEWYENNPMTVIEGFALGKPVIGARIGGIPELIKEGFNGYLFDSGDLDDLTGAVQKAQSISNDAYRSLGENARNFAEEHFNENKHYHELLKIYQKLLTDRP
ncbi:glycosyltransferase family 4 protein [Sulfurovum sp. XGS-02]|uniref:glycosyltransferase family 4 protein n=1 Tax=Sulfurovum sp. XGS-02 TaxID=2925411 RepID=UPI00206DA4E1|nr:glycosyltransferase family 4 protein [Sulfurovum sp. XGS-02]UPT76812.1 glycosyltransferase family 4 protein [Sulfurovum sp. XGS-02]